MRYKKKIVYLLFVAMLSVTVSTTNTGCCLFKKKSGCPANTSLGKDPMNKKKHKTSSGVMPSNSKKSKKKKRKK